MAKPRIGITMLCAQEGLLRYCKVQQNYFEVVCAAGGIPILIPPCTRGASYEDYLKIVDGLLFTGGEDVSPLMYNENPIKALGVTNLERDRWELDLYKAAVALNMPILGICRGIQIINVAEGGSLYQDINLQTESILGHFPAEMPMESFHHYIEIKKESKLFQVYKRDRLLVNSFHHQAIKEPGAVFNVTARSGDGIIEAIERPDRDFVLGLQFHAEALPKLNEYYFAPFRSLVNYAATGS